MRLIAIATLLLSACLTRTIPPPAPPTQSIPAIDNPPLPVAGKGTITLDSDDGPAVVEDVLAHGEWSGTYVSGSSEDVAPVCTTPCIANLDYGQHRLRFMRTDDDSRVSYATVQVGGQPSVFRYHVGLYKVHPAKALSGILGVTVGGALLLGGVTLVALPDERGIGAALLIPGAIVTAIGAWLWHAGRVDVQDGAGVEWTPGASAFNH